MVGRALKNGAAYLMVARKQREGNVCTPLLYFSQSSHGGIDVQPESSDWKRTV
jgi:hypothetical protein